MPTRTRGAPMDRGDSQPSKKRARLSDSEPLSAAAVKPSPPDANNNQKSPKSKKSNALNLSRRTSMRFTKLTIEPLNKLGNGKAYTFGLNDFGQLGIRPLTAPKRKFPALVDDLQDKSVKEVTGGSLHTVILTTDGKIYTFGNNDDYALGRETEEEEDMKIPGLVDFPYPVIMVSSGDSHVAVLTEHGQVFAWGAFRDANGFFGLIADDPREKISQPCRIHPHPQNNIKIVKIASGANHLVLLSEDGIVYTCGDNENGQLGREHFARATRSCPGVESKEEKLRFKLKPMEVKFMKKIVGIWAGSNMTFFKSADGVIWACGLNATNQLGLENKPGTAQQDQIFKLPKRVKAFDGRDWRQIAMGEHHTIALDSEGKVFAIGRSHDGRLGLGVGADLPPAVAVPTKIPRLDNMKCVQVGCGGTTSYAITDDCKLYAWGFGVNWQLGNGEEDDREEPTLCVSARDSPGIHGKVTFVSGGTQHTVIIIAAPENE